MGLVLVTLVGLCMMHGSVGQQLLVRGINLIRRKSNVLSVEFGMLYCILVFLETGTDDCGGTICDRGRDLFP